MYSYVRVFYQDKSNEMHPFAFPFASSKFAFKFTPPSCSFDWILRHLTPRVPLRSKLTPFPGVRFAIPVEFTTSFICAVNLEKFPIKIRPPLVGYIERRINANHDRLINNS